MISEVDIKDWEFPVEVTCVKENPDGSADCELKISPAGLRYLINFAFVTTLKEALEKGKGYTPGEATE